VAAAQGAPNLQVQTPVAPQIKAAVKGKSRVRFISIFIPSMGSSNVCKVQKEADILPANLVMNEKIKQLRERWECSMTTRHSEFCFIPAEGPHFALSHDLTEKWAAAIVRSFTTYHDHVHL
jgi:hypothetical protein